MMYEGYYGLTERPFDLAPDPRFLFLSRKHREALAHVQCGLAGRAGVTLLTGEAGTGKTTLIRVALQQLAGASASAIVHLSNPTLTRAEFFEYLAAGFGLGPAAANSKTRFLAELEARLAARARERAGLALVVDEAQSLPRYLLEEVRLLTNLDVAPAAKFAVVLVGQPEFADQLNAANLRQLKQRVSLRCELGPLDPAETAAYIAARIRVAGGSAETLFTRDAVLAIHQRSKGIPRTISVICDNALVAGFATDVKPVGRGLVLEVCRDFQLGPARSNGNGNSAPEPRNDNPAREPEYAPGSARPAPAARPPMFADFTRPRRFSFF